MSNVIAVQPKIQYEEQQYQIHYNKIFYINQDSIDADLLGFLKNSKLIHIERSNRDDFSDEKFYILKMNNGQLDPHDIKDFSDMFLKYFITTHDTHFRYIPEEFITYDLCEYAVRKYAHNLKYIPKELIDENLCKLAYIDFSVRNFGYEFYPYFERYSLLDEKQKRKYYEIKVEIARKDIINIVNQIDDLNLLNSYIDALGKDIKELNHTVDNSEKLKSLEL